MRSYFIKKLFLTFISCHFFLVVNILQADTEPSRENASVYYGETHTLEIISQVYPVEKIYKSMEGPVSQQDVKLWEGDSPELLWITGYRTIIVGEDGQSPVSQEFMCHNNLDFDPAQHRELLKWNKLINSRIFTLSQGQFSIDLPKGFGIPVYSNEKFKLTTQVLNHNYENPNIKVRHKVKIDFIRDKDIKAPLKPLYASSAFVMALIEGKDGFFGVDKPNKIQEEATCLPGSHAPSAKGSGIFPDRFGRKFSGHWVVKPGREVRRTLVTKTLNLPFDTTIHYIAIHLHPFAETLTLRDLTTGEIVFTSHVRPPEKGIGIDHVDSYASEEGIPLYKDHEYEMISAYNNVSGVDQDAMATMFFYLLDKEFDKSSLDPA